MNLLNKALFGVVIGTLAFSLVGCSGKTQNEDLQKAQESAAAANSYQANLTLGFGFGSEEEQSIAQSISQISYVAEPMTKRILSQATDGQVQYDELDVYIEQNNDAETWYTQYDGQWVKLETNFEYMSDVFGLYNVCENAAVFLENSADMKEVGKEDVNGVAAIRYDGVISKENVFQAIEETGALQYLGLGTLDPTYFKNAPDAPFSIWIEETEKTPVRYTVDFTDVLQSSLDVLYEAYSEQDPEAELQRLVVAQYAIDATIENINQVEPIQIPEEVKNAVPIEQIQTGSEPAAE